jgi:hypothetical protein
MFTRPDNNYAFSLNPLIGFKYRNYFFVMKRKALNGIIRNMLIIVNLNFWFYSKFSVCLSL